MKLLKIYTELGCKMSILLWIVVKKCLEVTSIREGRGCYMLDTMLLYSSFLFPLIPNGPTVMLVSLF